MLQRCCFFSLCVTCTVLKDHLWWSLPLKESLELHAPETLLHLDSPDVIERRLNTQHVCCKTCGTFQHGNVTPTVTCVQWLHTQDPPVLTQQHLILQSRMCNVPSGAAEAPDKVELKLLCSAAECETSSCSRTTLKQTNAQRRGFNLEAADWFTLCFLCCHLLSRPACWNMFNTLSRTICQHYSTTHNV